jgi:predicted phosphodiesterase
VHIVNPGSLGQPRHGLPSATYAVWEDGHLQIKHIDYVPSRRKTKSG